MSPTLGGPPPRGTPRGALATEAGRGGCGQKLRAHLASEANRSHLFVGARGQASCITHSPGQEKQ